MTAFVYVMDHLRNGNMKIGFSKDPYERRRSVRGARSVLATWEHATPYKVEQAAHRLLAEFAQGAEWFAVTRDRAFDAVREAVRALGLMTGCLPSSLVGSYSSWWMMRASGSASSDPQPSKVTRRPRGPWKAS